MLAPIDNYGMAFPQQMQNTTTYVLNIMHAKVVESVRDIAISVQELQFGKHRPHSAICAAIGVFVCTLDVNPAAESCGHLYATDSTLRAHVFAVPVATGEEGCIITEIVKASANELLQEEIELLKNPSKWHGWRIINKAETIEQMSWSHIPLEAAEFAALCCVKNNDRKLRYLILALEIKHEQIFQTPLKA